MKVLGISAFYHDAAACLADDGVIVAAAQEERFTRIKNDPAFPLNAAHFCLQQGGLRAEDLDAVVFYEKPIIKFDRIVETFLAVAPRGFQSFHASFPLWMKDKLNVKKQLAIQLCQLGGTRGFWRERLRFSEHHLSHAASAFYPSPFQEAAVITLDGAGEWCTGSIWKGSGARLERLAELQFPHSLGLLYSAFTQYLGFRVNEGEYKVMGLAAYGQPRFTDLIKSQLVHIRDDGSFWLDMSYFDFTTGITMTNRRFHALFGEPPRSRNGVISQLHKDIAHSIQKVTEEVILAIARHARALTGVETLCMAGGVALNCSANGVLRRSELFGEIWIQPAAGDAGGAIGAALAYEYLSVPDRQRIHGKDGMQGALLGPAHATCEIVAALQHLGLPHQVLAPEQMLVRAAQALAEGKIIGWMQGRAEFGPRALGARSILASAATSEMRDAINHRVKRREAFRPFAPSVLAEKAADWFVFSSSPYMLFTCAPLTEVQSQRIPAAVHIDGTSRVQTVAADSHPVFHALLQEYERITGVPVLLNTSFNVKDEPIVNAPEDAIRCMLSAGLDMLVMGNVIVENVVLHTA
ncbi:MAG: carbamoyltransferase family protein [Moraxellaceae bacterium]